LNKVIKEMGMERLAYRLFDAIQALVKRVDLQNYAMFRAIMLKEGEEWDDIFADAGPDDRRDVYNVATAFFKVYDMVRC
jgi:hypothetical protein